MSDLNAIRARHLLDSECDWEAPVGERWAKAHIDRGILLAEVDALSNALSEVAYERNQALSENDRLRIESLASRISAYCRRL